MDKPAEMKSATIYVPVAGSQCDRAIDPASGIVGTQVGDMLVLYMEGNRYGAENLRHYRERIENAAGRLFTRYPTIAKLAIPAADAAANLVAVGTIREKTAAEKEERKNAMSSSYIARASESERERLARNWDSIMSAYVITWDDAERAAAYGGKIG